MSDNHDSSLDEKENLGNIVPDASDESPAHEDILLPEEVPSSVSPELLAQVAIPQTSNDRPSRMSRDRRGNRQGGDRKRSDRRGERSGFEPVKKEFEEVLLQVSRVTKVTRGGRQLRFRATVAIGDKNGRVGLGIGKAGEVAVAVEKAVNSAKRHLVKVPLVEGTIPHQVDVKFKSVKIMIHPAVKGTGIIAGGSARRILELAGCQDILSKRHGGRNIITTAYATMEALKMLRINEK